MMLYMELIDLEQNCRFNVTQFVSYVGFMILFSFLWNINKLNILFWNHRLNLPIFLILWNELLHISERCDPLLAYYVAIPSSIPIFLGSI